MSWSVVSVFLPLTNTKWVQSMQLGRFLRFTNYLNFIVWFVSPTSNVVSEFPVVVAEIVVRFSIHGNFFLRVSLSRVNFESINMRCVANSSIHLCHAGLCDHLDKSCKPRRFCVQGTGCWLAYKEYRQVCMVLLSFVMEVVLVLHNWKILLCKIETCQLLQHIFWQQIHPCATRSRSVHDLWRF